MSFQSVTIMLLTVAVVILIVKLQRQLQQNHRNSQQIDKLSLAALENESRLYGLEKIEKRYRYELQRADRLMLNLLEAETNNDELAQRLAETRLEVDDTMVILERQSTEIELQKKLDAEESKRIELLERVLSESKDIIRSFIVVRENGNGKSYAGKIVRLMSKHFSVDHLHRFCLLTFNVSSENMHKGGTLVDRCTDIFIWCEKKGLLPLLISSLEKEFDHVEWRY